MTLKTERLLSLGRRFGARPGDWPYCYSIWVTSIFGVGRLDFRGCERFGPPR